MYDKADKKFMAIVTAIFFCSAFITGAIYIGAELYKAQRAVAERDRLITEYRERDAEVARINRELTERNQRLEQGLEDIRGIAGTATGNLRQAISIISGVKSVLEKMEDDSYSRLTGVSGNRVDSGTGN